MTAATAKKVNRRLIGHERPVAHAESQAVVSREAICWSYGRIHGYLNDLSPDEFETAYTAITTDHNQTENHNIQPTQNPF